MTETMFDRVREQAPHIHNITNYVTAHDCANIILACGGLPVMADDPAEVMEITAGCDALVINTGTPSERTIRSMLLAGQKANELGIPVILDPVGVGASKLRTSTVLRLLNEIHFSIIRGNASEIATLNDSNSVSKGVDVSEADKVMEKRIEKALNLAISLSIKTGAVIAVTGETDIVTDSRRAAFIRNGHPMMSRITGTGCMLSGVIGTLSASHLNDLLGAVVTGVSVMGICGELAYEKISVRKEGTGSFLVYLMDAMSNMDGDMLKNRSRVEMMDIDRYMINKS